MINWAINIVALVLVAYFFHKKVIPNISPRMYWVAYSIKVASGIMLGAIFIHQYNGGDSFTFYELGKTLLTEGNIQSSQPRTVFFSRCLVPFLWLTKNSYWLTAAYFSTISFFAYVYAAASLSTLYPKLRSIFLTCLLFTPTIIFWSSGILKGSLSNPALLFLVLMVIKIYRKGSINVIEMILAGISLIILLNVKHYLLITFLLFVGVLLAFVLLTRRRGSFKWIVAILILSGSFFMTQHIHPYLRVNRLAQTIYENNQAIYQQTQEDKRLDIVIEEPHWHSIAPKIPTGLYTGLFRPGIHDHVPIWGIFHQLENFVLLTLSAFSLILLIRDGITFDWKLIAASLVCICILATLLALTTPNLGSLVRYRNAFLPFLFILASSLPYQYIIAKTN